MIIERNGYRFSFRECDTKGMTVEEVTKLACEKGRMQYETNGAWLVVPGVGYGADVTYLGSDEL